MEATLGTVGQEAAGKYLMFRLGQEYFGMKVCLVREIIQLTHITTVPQMPEHVRGVINLRGKIIPVTDLRLKLGLPCSADDGRTCIIVVQIPVEGNSHRITGLIVDAMDEVANVSASEIEATPEFGTAVNTAYLVGVAKVKGQVRLLLDIHQVVIGDAMA